MTKIEVWGPVTWTFLHTLAEKIKTEDPIGGPPFIKQVLNIIINICSALPCPDCAAHASQYLRGIQNRVNTKDQLKYALFMLHNSVNRRKQKPEYNYALIDTYKQRQIVNCYRYFTEVYHTNGNLSLIGESFQRSMVLANLRKWFGSNLSNFNMNVEPINQHITRAFLYSYSTSAEHFKEPVVEHSEEPVVEHSEEPVVEHSEEPVVEHSEEPAVVITEEEKETIKEPAVVITEEEVEKEEEKEEKDMEETTKIVSTIVEPEKKEPVVQEVRQRKGRKRRTT